MTSRLEDLPMCKADPSLLLPWPKRSPEQRELVRKQLVELFSCNPLYIAAAKRSGNEAGYWSKFTVGGIVHPLKASTDYSPKID